MRILRAVLPIGLFFLATGFTDCDNFEEVTVPSRDVTDPSVFGGVWKGDRASGWYELVALDDDGFTYNGTYGEPLTLFAGGTDDGGVKTVKLRGLWFAQCYDNGINKPPTPHIGDFETEQSQPGEVGDTVSNGVYHRHTIPKCAAGVKGTYSGMYYARVYDFHGNETRTGQYDVVLKSPGL